MNLDIEPSEIASSLRLRRAASSLAILRKRYGKILILSHRGRPKGRDGKLSLRPISEALSKAIRKKIIFLDNSDLCFAREAFFEGEPGVYMLENLRFLSGENDNDPVLAKKLASLGEVFVNDDFATAHRAAASNVGITSFIRSLPGPTLKDEVAALKKAVKRPARPFVLVVGGVKMSDKLPVIDKLLPAVDRVLLGGGVGNTFIKASGSNVGKSVYEKNLIKEASRLSLDDKVVFPIDCRMKAGSILDIGPNTAALYASVIKEAGTVIWAGPLGCFETKGFSGGSEVVAKACATTKAYTLIGGGETTSIVIGMKLDKKIGFMSTGGGAMLDFLAGKKLPALDVLKISY